MDTPTARSCALRSRELDEPLAGSAVRATGWVCIEHRGGWTPRAPSSHELGSLVERLDVPGVRTQLVRAVRRSHTAAPPGGSGPLTVLLAHTSTDPAARWVVRLRVAHLDELAAVLDPAVTTVATPPALGEPVTTPVWLVCTHGRRDACCALHGRPVAAGLRDAGAEVWETTHVGGHRFAATAVLLPDGLSLGRLDTVPGALLLDELQQGRVDPALLRGRSALPGPAQAAEVALRTHLDERGRDAVRVTDWTTAGDTTTVALTVGDRGWAVSVRTAPATPARPVSDGAEPTSPLVHTVVELAPR